MDSVIKLPWQSPADFLGGALEHPRFLMLGGQGASHWYLSTDFHVAPHDACHAQTWGLADRTTRMRPWISLNSYSDSAADGGESGATFFLENLWHWDVARQQLTYWGRSPATLSPQSMPATPWMGLELQPTCSDATYQHQVNEVLNDIRQGRYYQLNLLRYFNVTTPVSRQALAQRWLSVSGPMSAWLKWPGKELVSFSPERFLQVNDQGERDSVNIVAEPIKGTAAVIPGDPEQTARLGEELIASAKNRAELAMIVDLLRNDMHRIAVPHSVRVEEVNALHAFNTVQHLIARVTGQLPRHCSLADLWRATAPGGSITGAPKKAVMAAIHRYEGRPRDYFMGHIACFNPWRQQLDASLLIRTLVFDGETWRYAAGSGLTIQSDPVEETAEIYVKCRIISC